MQHGLDLILFGKVIFVYKYYLIFSVEIVVYSYKEGVKCSRRNRNIASHGTQQEIPISNNKSTVFSELIDLQDRRTIGKPERGSIDLFLFFLLILYGNCMPVSL